jgi:parallel beta-helix repeat protein
MMMENKEKKMRRALCVVMSLIWSGVCFGAELYVSPEGNDKNPGSKEKPLLTLEGARDLIRAARKRNAVPAGGVTVFLRGGTHVRTSTFALTKEDSGRPGSPITYCSFPGEKAVVIGGVRLDASKAVAVKDAEVLARIPESARSMVRVLDLAAHGVKGIQAPGLSGHSMGNLQKVTRYKIGAPASEVFFNDQPLTLARWPNEGFTTVGKVVSKGDTTRHWEEDQATLPEYVPKDKRKDPPDGFAFQPKDASRLDRWTTASDMLLLGYWFVDYSDQVVQVAKIDTSSKTLHSVQPSCYGIASGKRFYAFNLLEELDVPGEWYIDHKTQKLYLYPPSDAPGGTVSISLLGEPLVSMEDVFHVTFSGLSFSDTRGNGVSIKDGGEITLNDCELTNMSGSAVVISGGTGHRVAGCEIAQCGGTGISAEGGDRIRLTPAKHVIENNHIHHFARLHRTYNPGIRINGVGIRVSNNEIAHAPHAAIIFGGNEHLIEKNHIHQVAQEAADMGAVYAGRSWHDRGTIIRHNLFRDIRTFQKTKGHAVKAIYLDDGLSGIQVEGNLLINIDQGIMINGGRDNTVKNNLFVGCGQMMRGTDLTGAYKGWAKASWNTLHERLNASPFKSPGWRERYPNLHTILDENPEKPKGNIVTENACYNTPIVMNKDGIQPGFQAVSTVGNNHKLTRSPGAFDDAKQRYVLNLDDDLKKQSPGIAEIPWQEIGRK